jgi:hypothetical protein
MNAEAEAAQEQQRRQVDREYWIQGERKRQSAVTAPEVAKDRSQKHGEQAASNLGAAAIAAARLLRGGLP